MAGHSHWANIKRHKGVVDARRGRLWSKLARNIIVAAKTGGGDPSMNLALRYAIDKARDANMPMDTIDKAIKKGTGELEGSNYAPVTYEGYGPGGVAFIVDALTDNPHRTAPEIKKIFERGGGNMGATNCVGWNFTTRGVFTIGSADTTEEALMEIALDAGAEDIVRDGELFQVTCAVQSFDAVRKALEVGGVPVQNKEITKIPGTSVRVDEESGVKILKLIEMFEDHDDVQNVYTNFDMSEEVMARIGG